MLTVWCVKIGTKYSDADVLMLRAQVKKHLSVPHNFWCLSDRITPVSTIVAKDAWPGWWSKLAVFRFAGEGKHLYLDLDSVVVRDLEPLLSDQLSMPANWAQSGHGGAQSCVMAWSGDYGWITNKFDPSKLIPDPHHPHGRYGTSNAWGDQGLLTEWLGSPGDGVIHPMQGVASYKYHCRDGLPDWARVVQFHGDPKPSQVQDEWVKASRSSTAILH